MQTDRIAELRAAAQQPREPDGYAYRYPDPTGIGRKGVIRFGTGGRSVNGSLPLESIPYWLGSPPPAQHPVIQAVFRCGPSGEPGDDFIGEKEAPLWGLPEIEDDGTITVPVDYWPAPIQQPMTDEQIVATARSLGWATEYGGLGEDAIALSRAVERYYGIGKEGPK